MNKQQITQLLKSRLLLVVALALALLIGSVVTVREYNHRKYVRSVQRELGAEELSESQFKTTPQSPADAYVADFKYVSEVKVSSNGFSPANVVVKPQTKVTITAGDDASHFIALAPGSASPKYFDPQIDITRNSMFQMKFETAGTYSFFDRYNPMASMVIVVSDK